jgi:prefoldin subunit 5
MFVDNFTFEFFRKKLEEIRNAQTKMEAKIMAAIDDLNKAIQDEDVEISDLTAVVTKVDADITALLAKIQAGGISPEQIAAALQAIQSHTVSVKTAVDALTADDTKANA